MCYLYIYIQNKFYIRLQPQIFIPKKKNQTNKQTKTTITNKIKTRKQTM